MHRLSPSWLEAFVTTADSKTLVEAAKALGISQPTLSRQLQQLEDNLPLPLFEFQGRKKVLTHYGVALQRALQSRLSDLTNIVTQVGAHFSDPKNAHLRIMGRREVLHPFIPQLAFEGTLRFFYAEGEAIVEAMVSRKTDIAVTQRLPDSLHVTAKPLFKRGFSLVVPKKFSPVKPEFSARGLKFLKDWPCLAFSDDFHSLGEFASHISFKAGDLRCNRICSDWMTLKELAQAQVGWALLPSTRDLDEKKLWVWEIPTSVVGLTPFYLLYLTELGSIPWFIQFVKSWQKVADPWHTP